MLRYAVGRSGGLTYHFTALRHARMRWAPFRARVRNFLAQTWNPLERELIVVGASAGWTLPLDWLATFERVIVVEPDPIARLILARRFDRECLEFDHSPERLPWFASGADRAHPLATLLASNPRAAVLFTNVLGQLGVLLEGESPDGCRELFLGALAQRNWASYHDVLSTSAPFRNPWPENAPPDHELETLARHFLLGDAEIVDHETLWLGNDSAVEFAPWALSPGKNHLIGFVSPKKP